MKIPFINSRNADQEIETPWADRVVELALEDVADLRRIADEVDNDNAKTLRAIADNYELMTETYD